MLEIPPCLHRTFRTNSSPVSPIRMSFGRCSTGFRAFYFFVKDRESRLMAASRTIFGRLGRGSEAELLGARDEDLFPPHVARGYRDDDMLGLSDR